MWALVSTAFRQAFFLPVAVLKSVHPDPDRITTSCNRRPKTCDRAAPQRALPASVAMAGEDKLPDKQLAPDGLAARLQAAAVLEGFRYLSGNQVVLMSFVVDIIAMVFGMPRALFPQMANQSF